MKPVYSHSWFHYSSVFPWCFYYYIILYYSRCAHYYSSIFPLWFQHIPIIFPIYPVIYTILYSHYNYSSVVKYTPIYSHYNPTIFQYIYIHPNKFPLYSHCSSIFQVYSHSSSVFPAYSQSSIPYSDICRNTGCIAYHSMGLQFVHSIYIHP